MEQKGKEDEYSELDSEITKCTTRIRDLITLNNRSLFTPLEHIGMLRDIVSDFFSKIQEHCSAQPFPYPVQLESIEDFFHECYKLAQETDRCLPKHLKDLTIDVQALSALLKGEKDVLKMEEILRMTSSNAFMNLVRVESKEDEESKKNVLASHRRAKQNLRNMARKLKKTRSRFDSSLKLIEKLQTTPDPIAHCIASSPEKICAVCSDKKLVPELDFAILDCCPHVFCTTCMEEWLKIKKSCPICRQNVSLTITSAFLRDDGFNWVDQLQ